MNKEIKAPKIEGQVGKLPLNDRITFRENDSFSERTKRYAESIGIDPANVHRWIYRAGQKALGI